MNMKYLIVISYMERRITKIIHQAKDEVFEDYESIYEVQASNLYDVKAPYIVWDLS